MARHYEMVTASRKEALAATEEILNDNGIRQQCSADMSKVWDLSRAKWGGLLTGSTIRRCRKSLNRLRRGDSTCMH